MDEQPEEFVEALETVSRGIHDPVAKLRYLRDSLGKHPDAERYVRGVPSEPVRRAIYRWLSLEDLRTALKAAPLGAQVTLDRPLRRSLFARNAAVACAGLAVAAGLAAVGRQSAVPTAAAPRVIQVARAAPPVPAASPTRAVVPAAIWLVEKGPNFELYSNGLRIETAFATPGDERRYQVFDDKGVIGPVVAGRPAGIVFHTSESDIWPLTASFNENLRDSSQRLLRYVRRNHLYNYMIDRFGRVYRVVEESAKANHAGNSVWSRPGEIYVGLNASFLGICFETRWDGGKALPITRAQLLSGQNLSDYLRQRWDIAPEMCVTHGLASINPARHLIGHHLDWARGFPFEAFGLPDQYARPAPSVAVFGFDYDDDFLKVLGEPWAGVRAAERALAAEATRRGTTVEELRHERQQLYDRWSAPPGASEQPVGIGSGG
ncbi:MAG TPA: peptidoglycan recognition family protein [Vicinamibacteria bacterium]